MKKYAIPKILTVLFAAALLPAGGCGGGGKNLSPETGSATESKNPAADTGTAIAGETAGMKMGAAGTAPDYGMPEDGVMRAMTIADSGGNLYYADVNTGAFFTAPIPGDVTDAGGKMLPAEAVKAGCIVDIYGNGMMLESYPGQYPGTTKMVVLKDSEDTSPYQYLLDGISGNADPSEPPSMNAEYSTKLANASVVLTRGGYEWNYTDADGKTQSVIADSAHILEWPELIDIAIDESVKGGQLGLRLSSFPQKPQSVTVTRFPLDLWKASGAGNAKESKTETAVLDKAEEVALQDDGAGYTLTAESGYVYLVEAKWKMGRAEFGFLTHAL